LGPGAVLRCHLTPFKTIATGTVIAASFAGATGLVSGPTIETGVRCMGVGDCFLAKTWPPRGGLKWDPGRQADGVLLGLSAADDECGEDGE